MLDKPIVLDDHSGAFAAIRARLTDSENRPYVPFVRSLKPRYAVVYRDIAMGYAFLILSAVFTWLACW